MTRRLSWLVPVALAIVVLAACGDEPAGGSQPGGSVEGDWVLAEGTADGQPLVLLDDLPVTLTINGDQATGISACNSYFGTVEIDGGTIRFAGLGGTEMGCDPDVMALEVGYLTALADVREAALEDGRLVLRGDGVELRFRAADPVPPVEPEALVGTVWLLDSIMSGSEPDASVSTPMGDPAGLLLADDGTFEGGTGCGRIAGTYEVGDDRLQLTTTEVDDQDCPQDVAAQVALLTELFAGPLTVSIKDDLLTLTAEDGRGLVLRADRSGDGTEPPPSGPAEWWLLRSGQVDGEHLDLARRRVTLEISGSTGGASAGCNGYGLSVRVDGSDVRIMVEGGTDMGCGDLTGLETAYLEALDAARTIEQSEDRLVLTGPTSELVFERLPDLDPATVVDRTWVLDALLDASGSATAVVGASQLVLADDGTFRGEVDDCTVTGSYVITGDHVTTAEQSVDGACTSEVAQRVLAMLEGGVVPSIDGDTMTILEPDGTGQVWVAEGPAG